MPVIPRLTHTYAILPLSREAYEEIRQKLETAGYKDQFLDEGEEHGVVIDMHGIAVSSSKDSVPAGWQMLLRNHVARVEAGEDPRDSALSVVNGLKILDDEARAKEAIDGG